MKRDAGDPLQERLAALRASGAPRVDPVGWHYAETLARRIPEQPETVQRLLQEKLEIALAACAERVAQAKPQAAPPAHEAARPLAALNEHIRKALAARALPASPGEAQDPRELPSVRRFRAAWDRQRTVDQVRKAAARKPANAGPLNSHALVLQSLALMQELSPDYLRRFLVQVEALQWLELARDRLPRAAAPAAKKTRANARRAK